MSAASNNQSELQTSASYVTSNPGWRARPPQARMVSSSWTEVMLLMPDWALRTRRWRARSQQHSLSNTEHLTAPRHNDGRQHPPRPRTAAGLPEEAQRSVRRVRRGRRRIYSCWALRGPRSTVRPRRWSKNLSLYNHSLVSFFLECLAFNIAEHFCTLHLNSLWD